MSKIKVSSLLTLLAMVCFALLFPERVLAQQASIRVYGKITENDKKLSGAVVALYANGALLKTINVDGKYELNLELGVDYMITYTKPGYITKKIEFNTKNVPPERAKNPFSDFPIDIDIFPEIPGTDIDKVLSQPIGKILFDPSFEKVGDFQSDEAYHASIQSLLDKIEQARKDALAKAKEIDAQYKKLIAKADAEFTAKDYTNAKSDYQSASALKTGEQYPKDQLAAIDKAMKDANSNAQAAALAAKNKRTADSLAAVQKSKDAAAALAAKNKRTADSLAAVQKSKDAAAALAAKNKRTADSLAAVQKSKDAAAALAAKNKRTADSLAALQKSKDAAAALAAKNKRTADSLAAIQKSKDAAAALAAKNKRTADSLAAVQKSKDAAIALAAKNKRTADSLAAVQKNKDAAAALAAKNKRTADSLAAVQKSKDAAAALAAKNKRTADSLAAVQKSKDAAAALAAKNKRTADSLAQLQKGSDDKYNTALAKANQYYLTKNYKPALTAYQQASALKPNEAFPKQRIAQIQQILANTGQTQVEVPKLPKKDTASDPAVKDSLALKYPQGTTEEHIDEPGCEVTRRIVVKGFRGWVYTRKVWSWGQTYYFKGEDPITESIWNTETTSSN